MGRGVKLDQAVAALAEADLDTFERELTNFQEKKRELEEALKVHIDERGGLRRQIEDMEHNEETSSLRLDFHAKREQLGHLSRSWAIHTLAHTLVEEARRYYERERQPGVIAEAEKIFAGVTDNHYTHVRAPLDGSGVYIQTDRGERRDLGELSRGTAEQLYFAIRLGLIREFGRSTEPLPVIMDDIMVNFDKHRAQQTVQALAEFARNHQVILLTCHEATETLFRNSGTECCMMSLSE